MDARVWEELFVTAEQSPRCKKCKYRASSSSKTICYYCGHTGQMRKSSIEDCTRFEEGRALRIKGVFA